MTEQEIRRALAIVERALDPDEIEDKLVRQVMDESTGYAATLRALLEARELLRDCQEELPFGTQSLADLNERVRAFLAEGESK